MVLTNKQVAIIGGGPVGLTMARLLHQTGIAVTVYERDKDPQARIWGGTLDLHDSSGQKAMEKAGLLERYFALARPMGRTMTDKQGNAFLSIEPHYDSPEINRNDLRQLLLHSLPNDTVVWDRKLTGLEEQAGKWRLHFDNKPDATADFVIGANGGMSNVRKYVADAEVEDTGTYILQGEVIDPERNCAAFYHLCAGNILMSAYAGNLLVANPSNAGLLTYNVMFKTPEEWDHETAVDFQKTDSIRLFLSDRFADWNALYKQLFQSTTSFWGLPTKKLALDKPWKTKRPLPVTLIGDAAHLMPPFAGQGVNTGLLDTVTLFDSLTNGTAETVEAAIADYEQKMIVYATEAQRESSQNEQQMRLPDFTFQKLFH